MRGSALVLYTQQSTCYGEGESRDILETEIRWTNIVRYLGIYLVSAKMFRRAIDNSKKSFYRSFNSIFELLKVKCQYSSMAWKFAHLLKPRYSRWIMPFLPATGTFSMLNLTKM